jgi:hypothetical protein
VLGGVCCVRRGLEARAQGRRRLVTWARRVGGHLLRVRSLHEGAQRLCLSFFSRTCIGTFFIKQE